MNLRRNVYLIFLIRHKYYQDTVDALRSIFDRLNLILIGEAAIHFKDAEARRICLGVWDADKDGCPTGNQCQHICKQYADCLIQ